MGAEGKFGWVRKMLRGCLDSPERLAGGWVTHNRSYTCSHRDTSTHPVDSPTVLSLCRPRFASIFLTLARGGLSAGCSDFPQQPQPPLPLRRCSIWVYLVRNLFLWSLLPQSKAHPPAHPLPAPPPPASHPPAALFPAFGGKEQEDPLLESVTLS